MSMMNMRYRTVITTVAVLAVVSVLHADDNALQNAMEIVRGNERFGRSMLQQVHSKEPDKNVVVSPLSVTIAVTAIGSNSWGDPRKEINRAFGWGDIPLAVPSRMLLAAFVKPPLVHCRQNPKEPVRVVLPVCWQPEGAWISNALLYRTPTGIKEPISKSFVDNLKNDFGFTLVSTGAAKPTGASIRKVRRPLTEIPKVSPQNDVLISSGTHLQSRWGINVSDPIAGEFRTASGELRRVTTIATEVDRYPHVKTDTFEAVELPFNNASFLAILPAPGTSIQELEKQLSANPREVDDVLRQEEGEVVVPVFHLRSESQLRPAIEALGIKSVFKNLDQVFDIPNSYLNEINQHMDILVNEDGIRADAETVAGGVYGGVAVPQKPFHMQLNRPFVFLVRDRNTNALLFIGAVMDPTQN